VSASVPSALFVQLVFCRWNSWKNTTIIVKLASLGKLVRHNRLRWFGHIERKFDDDWVKKCLQLVVESKTGRGEVRRCDQSVGGNAKNGTEVR